MSEKKLIKWVEVSFHRKFLEEGERDLLNEFSDKLDIVITNADYIRLKGDYTEIKNLRDDLLHLSSLKETQKYNLQSKIIRPSRACDGPEVSSRRSSPPDNHEMLKRLSIESINNKHNTNREKRISPLKAFPQDVHLYLDEVRKRERDPTSPDTVNKKTKFLNASDVFAEEDFVTESFQLSCPSPQGGQRENLLDNCNEVTRTLRRLSTNNDSDHWENQVPILRHHSPIKDYQGSCELPMELGKDFTMESDGYAIYRSFSPVPKLEEIRTFREMRHESAEPHGIMAGGIADEESTCNPDTSFSLIDDTSSYSQEWSLRDQGINMVGVQTGCSLFGSRNMMVADSGHCPAGPLQDDEGQAMKKSPKYLTLQKSQAFSFLNLLH